MIENRRSLAFLFCFGSYGASLWSTLVKSKVSYCLIIFLNVITFLMLMSYFSFIRLQASSANKYWVEQVVKLADKERENLEVIRFPSRILFAH